jgi:hypothetical protein
VREIFAASLVKQGTIAADAPESLVKQRFTKLEETFASLKPEQDFVAPIPEPVPAGIAGKTQTGVAIS